GPCSGGLSLQRSASANASVLLLLQDLDLLDPRPLLEGPLEPDPRLERDLLDLGDRLLVRPAAVLGRAAAPVRHVAPRLFLPVRLHLDPVVALGGDHSRNGP